MKKKIFASFSVLLLFLTIMSGCSERSSEPYDLTTLKETVAVNDKIVYVVRQDYKEPVFSRNETRSTRPGALNHIMVALLVMEKCPDPVNTEVKSTENTFVEIAGKNVPNIDMAPGETYSIDELLKAMLISNAYDATNLLAEYVGGDAGIPGCVEQMNAKIREIAQTEDTVFVDPNGIIVTNQHTTAADFYKLTSYLLQTQPAFIGYFSEQSFTTKKRVNQREFTGSNYNPFTTPSSAEYYPGAAGISFTSYTDDQQTHDNLISLVTIDGFQYIAIFMDVPGSGSDFSTETVFDPAAATSSETSSSETSSDDSEGEATPPETDPNPVGVPTTIFSDAKEVLSWMQSYVRWVPFSPDTEVLYTDTMDPNSQWKDVQISVGLAREGTQLIPTDSNPADYMIMCVGPTVLTDPVKKGAAVGEATIINLVSGETNTVNLVARNNTQTSPFVQLLILLLRIVIILCLIFAALIIFIRYRNMRLQQKRRLAKKEQARKNALNGKSMETLPKTSSPAQGTNVNRKSKAGTSKKNSRPQASTSKSKKRPPTAKK